MSPARTRPPAGSLDGRWALRWLECAQELLRGAAPRLDRMNVFPVADADTGSNMLATLTAAAEGARAVLAEGTPADLGAVLDGAGRAALDCARGNSGTLLAVALDGLAPPLAGVAALTTVDLAAAARGADTAARRALSDPREGTILSVLTVAADTLTRAAQAGRTPAEAAAATVGEALQAVAETESLLAPLSRAGVVDAGAVGVLWTLEALRATLAGAPVDEDLAARLHGYADGPARPAPEGRTAEDADGPGPEAGVEVMCTVRLTPVGAASVRRALEQVGDAVILAPASRTPDADGLVPWRVHVHVPQAQEALDVIAASGRPEQVAVTALTDTDHRHGVASPESAGTSPDTGSGRGR
ncbi:DAK2 domain-containing protein [Micrococcus sp.]|uniref:DAK2 domain-containing protein n=1 Tax=Micrococcus sp. TaxID=1271 RepID=UPI002A911DC6|nr:DAK2 domain-containing protein [Micrococcus sp.]MDY6055665.1 DAK2 domain-containing protein [Micrococcus sp.]